MPNFRFWIPADKIEKSVDEKSGKRIMKIGGIASTKRKDTDEESLDPAGFDIQYLKEKGIVNWNHSKLPEAVIGEPVKVQFKPKGGLYVESQLYSESELANKVYDLALMLEKSSKTRRLGYSIEGKVLERDPTDEKKVTKAMITNIALTISPKNPDSIVDIIKGEFHELGDNELIKSASDEANKLVNEANGGKIYIIDITRPDGNRITVDDNYNLKVEKCMSTVSAAPLIREHVDGEVKSDFLTKSEVFEKIFSFNSVISFNTANEIFEKLNKLTMENTSSKTKITDDLLNKALGTLGLKNEIEKSEGAVDTDTAIAKAEGTVEEGTTTAVAKVEEVKTPEIVKSVEPATTPVAVTSPDFTDLLKSLGIIAKGTYELQKANNELLLEVKNELKKSNDALEELGNSSTGRRSMTTAKVVERNFSKGNVDELSSNKAPENANTQLSISRDKTKIVALMDKLAFEKGFEPELAKAMTLFESSSQIEKATINFLNSKGFEIIN